MLGSQDGTKAVTIEIVVGALVTAVLVLLFLDISIAVKTILVSFLGIVGVLNFLALTGQTNKWRSKISQRRREGVIRKHPDLVSELYRMNQQIRKVAYDNNASHSSLAFEGDTIMVALVNEDESHDQTLLIEFKEKLFMAQSEYNQFQQRLLPYSQGLQHWKSTSEFASTLRDLSSNAYYKEKHWYRAMTGSKSETENAQIPDLYAKRDYETIVKYVEGEMQSMEAVYKGISNQPFYKELVKKRQEIMGTRA
jgi:hypothetical protein